MAVVSPTLIECALPLASIADKVTVCASPKSVKAVNVKASVPVPVVLLWFSPCASACGAVPAAYPLWKDAVEESDPAA